MRTTLYKYIACCLWGLLLGSTPALAAQDGDDYNPDFPAEPQMMVRVKVSCEPAEAANVSGGGMYAVGARRYINASATCTAYTFQYWTLNGERIDEAQSFYYTVTAASANLVAHFEYHEPEPEPEEPYNPSFPGEPTPLEPIHKVVRNPLYLIASPAGSCSFNRTSGAEAEADQSVRLRAYPNMFFKFNGWYHNGSIISTDLEFYYVMGNQPTTLTASFTYAPEFPEEPMEDPEKEQEEVDNGQNGILGDVNRDGMINTQDAVMLTKLYLAGDPDGQLVPSICDMNGDGVVNTADAVAIVNYYLTHVQ